MASIVFDDKDIVIKSIRETHAMNITSNMDSSQKHFFFNRLSCPQTGPVSFHILLLAFFFG